MDTTKRKRIFDCVSNGLKLLDHVQLKGINLFSGKTGHFLMYSYISKMFENNDYLEKASNCIDEIFNELQISLEKGIINAHNISWLLSTINAVKKDDILDINIDLETIKGLDLIIFQQAESDINNDNLDFIHGASGLINYLSTQVAHNPAAASYINSLLTKLMNKMLLDDNGTYFINSWIQKANNINHINLGLAHGQWGLVLVILNIFESGICKEQCYSILISTINFLISLRREGEINDRYESLFPHTIDLMTTNESSSFKYSNNYSAFIGWCYGDLNASLALYKASKILNKPELAKIADEVGIYSCTSLINSNVEIIGISMCHGSSSIVNLCQSLFNENPIFIYSEARDIWVNRTIKAIENNIDINKEINYNTLLTGLPGALLTLTGQELSTHVDWKRIFLL